MEQSGMVEEPNELVYSAFRSDAEVGKFILREGYDRCPRDSPQTIVPLVEPFRSEGVPQVLRHQILKVIWFLVAWSLDLEMDGIEP